MKCAFVLSLVIGMSGCGGLALMPEGSSTPQSDPPQSQPGPEPFPLPDGGTTAINPDGGTPLTPDAGTPPLPPAGTLPPINDSAISAAIAQSLSTFRRNSSGESYCAGGCDGAPVILAVAANAGKTSADARLLQQIRAVLVGGADPIGVGTYIPVLERQVTAALAISKRTPRVWNALTDAERTKVDLIMKATFVSDAYLTSDATGGCLVTAFDGEREGMCRDHNPNYREGAIGAVLVGAAHLGGGAAADAVLNSYDHAAFRQQLIDAGLTNLAWTFGGYWRGTSGAPSPATVQQGVRNYRLYGMSLSQLMDIYINLAKDTFGARVACGLNNGAGIVVNGTALAKIASGCETLPNLGALGMEKEFDSVDAQGKRSSGLYAELGLRAHLFNHAVLLATGQWQDTSASRAVLNQINIGVTDFFYKAQKGYLDYSKGGSMGTYRCGQMNCEMNQALWTEVLRPAHGL